MSRMQESEVRDRMGAAANTPAGKIRRAALLSKHMLEVEKFRYVLINSGEIQVYIE